MTDTELKKLDLRISLHDYHDFMTSYGWEGEFIALNDRDLSGMDLKDAYLREICLCNANLRGADLSFANLSDADLTGADLTGANLTGADLHGANLTGADFTDSILFHTDLRFANISETKNMPESMVPSVLL